MLWLGVIGSSLLFTTIFIIYLVRMHEEQNHFVALPDMFWLSTLVILFSSITLHEANLAFVQERFLHYRVFLGTTFILGVTFMLLQVSGWLEMIKAGAFAGENNSIAFVYLLTGLHLLHILGGIIYLSILFQKNPNVTAHLKLLVILLYHASLRAQRGNPRLKGREPCFTKQSTLPNHQ